MLGWNEWLLVSRGQLALELDLEIKCIGLGSTVEGPWVSTHRGHSSMWQQWGNVSHEGRSRPLSALERGDCWKRRRGWNNGLKEGRQWAQRVDTAGRQAEGAQGKSWMNRRKSEVKRVETQVERLCGCQPREFWTETEYSGFPSTACNYSDYTENCQFAFEQYFGNIPHVLIGIIFTCIIII